MNAALSSIRRSEAASNPTDNPSPDPADEQNFAWAAALVDGLIAAGADDFVLSPGAHAAPLILACRTNPQATVSVVLDERSAGFYALGRARASGRPTVVVCTSGSAVGHLYPAVIEASAVQAPLIVLAADRAPEAQDCCSPQAIDQIRAFGSQVRGAHHLPVPDHRLAALPAIAARIVEQCRFPDPGPVYVNQPFREPLYATRCRRSGPTLPPPARVHHAPNPPEPAELRSLAQTIRGRRGLIVCGSSELPEECARAVVRLAAATGCPVLADPLSGLRFASPERAALVSRADGLLRTGARVADLVPDWVISIGGPPVSAAVSAWLRRLPAMEFVVVDQTTRWPDPWRRATRLFRADPALFCLDLADQAVPAAADWLLRWKAEELRADDIAQATLGDELWEARVIAGLIAGARPGSVLFSGNSMGIRDFDSFSGLSPKPVRLVANRGVNGIDGGIATALGLAARRNAPVLAMIGDVAFAHDLGSLQIGTPGLDLVLVVVNNQGGAIFDYQGAAATPAYADFLCPPGLDITAAARACGWHTWQAAEPAAFEAALAEAIAVGGGCRLIEAVVDRRASIGRHRAFWQALDSLPSAAE